MTATHTQTRVFETLDDFRAAEGELLGAGEWLEITQERIDAFAEATGDHQWIHVDADRAARGPYGATIAHGFLTLSLIPLLGGRIFRVEEVRIALNYGANKVRFPHPVRVGARIRAVASLVDVADTPAGLQAVVRYTLEIEGETKPACVAETVRVLVA
jgi:acyl dehydratase